MDENKIWKKAEIKELLERNDRAVLRGMVVIYSLQTKDEQQTGESTDDNGVGFSKFDAEFCTSLAKQILERGTLSQKQMTYARKKIISYAGQLTKVANGKIKVAV